MQAENSVAVNRRKHDRYEVNRDVKLGNGMRNIHGRLLDISVGGTAMEWLDILEEAEIAAPVKSLVFVQFSTGLVAEGFVTAVTGNVVHIAFDIADDEKLELIDGMRDFTGAPLEVN